MTNELVQVVNQSGLEKSKIDSLMHNFTGYFTDAKTIAEQAKTITVTDETQLDQMQKARELRLKLKEIRVNAEKTKVELKEQSLREGNAIQGVFNIIKALIVPVEEHLEKQEKFAEVKEQERKSRVLVERIEKLSKYVNDVSLYSLENMADEVFNNLLAGCKQSWEKAREDEVKAEEERVAKVKAEREEQERVRLENEKLRREAEEKEKLLQKEREEQNKKFEEERKKREAVELKLKAEKEVQERKEREEREKAEVVKKAEEDAKREALLAPDKNKLMEFALNIDKLIAPSVASRDAGLILEKALVTLKDVSNFIREKSKTL